MIKFIYYIYLLFIIIICSSATNHNININNDRYVDNDALITNTIVSSSENLTITFYVKPQSVISNIACGNMSTPCSTILEAINSFLKQISDTRTNFKIVLYPGHHGNNGANDSISLNGLNIVFESFNNDDPAILYDEKGTNSSVFHVDDNTFSSNFSFRNIIFDVAQTIFNTSRLDKKNNNLYIIFNNCTFRTSETYLPLDKLLSLSQSFLEIKECSFINLNYSTVSLPLIELQSSNLLVSNSLFVNITFSTLLKSNHSQFIMENTTIENNSGHTLISSSGGDFIIRNVVISSNFLFNGILDLRLIQKIDISNSNFTLNNSSSNLGLIYNSTTSFYNTYFGSNRLIYNNVFPSPIYITNAVIISDTSDMVLDRCSFDYNQADSLIYQIKKTLKIHGSTFYGNFKTGQPTYYNISLLYLESTQATITNTQLWSLRNYLTVINMQLIKCINSIIYYNTTSAYYGADDSQLQCNNCILEKISRTEDNSKLECQDPSSPPSNTKKITLIVCLCVGVPLLIVIGVVIVIKKRCNKKQKSQNETDDYISSSPPSSSNQFNTQPTEVPLQQFNVSTYNYHHMMPPPLTTTTMANINVIPDDECSSSSTNSKKYNPKDSDIIPLD